MPEANCFCEKMVCLFARFAAETFKKGAQTAVEWRKAQNRRVLRFCRGPNQRLAALRLAGERTSLPANLKNSRIFASWQRRGALRRCQSAGFLLMPLCAQAKTKKWICPQKRPPLPYMPPGMVLGPIYLIDKGRRRKRVWRKEGVCVGRPERRRSTQMQNCFSSREIASNFWPSRTYGLRSLAFMRVSLDARLLP